MKEIDKELSGSPYKRVKKPSEKEVRVPPIAMKSPMSEGTRVRRLLSPNDKS